MADYSPHEAPIHDAASLPVSLPQRLIGRDVVLTKVYSHLKDNMAVHLHGPSGIGKTALCATLASAYTDLPGGVLWLDVNEKTPLAELIARVGRAYKITEIGESENPLAMVGAIASTLTQNKPLIVLDGKPDAQTARDFIARCADRLPLLLTADEQLVGPWTAIELDRLEPEQAAVMFKHLSGQDKPDGEENDGDVDRLVAAVECVPFGVAVAAGTVRANKQTPAEFLASLPQQPGVNGSLLALTASFRGLNNALQGLLLMIGASVGGEASADLLSMVSGVPQESLKQALLMLSHRQLAERFTRYGQPYYRLHALTYAFTQPLLRGSGKLDSLRQKFHDAVLSYAETFSAATPPAYDRLAAEMGNFLSLARWSSEQGDLETANQLATALMEAEDFVKERGYVYELLTLRRLAASSTSAFPAHEPERPTVMPPATLPQEPTAPAVTAPFSPFDGPLPYDDMAADDEDDDDKEEPEEETQDFGDDEDDDSSTVMPAADEEEMPAMSDEDALVQMAAQAENAGPQIQEPAEIARLRSSLMQARQQGNQNRQAELQAQIGQTYMRSGMDNEAIASFSEALTLYETLEDPSGTISALETLAKLTFRTDNMQAAVLYATRGAQTALEANDIARQARMLSLLGDARQQLGESEQAASAYTLALDLAQTLQDQEAEAMILLKLGYAQLDENDPQAAATTWERALPLVRQQNKRDLEGRVMGGLGTAYGELERWTEAIAFHNSALYIAREVGDKDEEALQLTNLAYASVQANQLGQAVLRYRQALHLAYESDNRDNIVSTIVDLAQLLVESPRHSTVAELLIDDAVRLEPNDRDVKRLKERIEDEKKAAVENNVPLIAVTGTARDYAANAYQLLDA